MLAKLLMTGVCLAAFFTPMAGRIVSTRRYVVLENPSSLELALTGAATLCLYVLWRRRTDADKPTIHDATTAIPGPDSGPSPGQERPSRRAA